MLLVVYAVNGIGYKLCVLGISNEPMTDVYLHNLGLLYHSAPFRR